jgi:hypothetical protein
MSESSSPAGGNVLASRLQRPSSAPASAKRAFGGRSATRTALRARRSVYRFAYHEPHVAAVQAEELKLLGQPVPPQLGRALFGHAGGDGWPNPWPSQAASRSNSHYVGINFALAASNAKPSEQTAKLHGANNNQSIMAKQSSRRRGSADCFTA